MKKWLDASLLPLAGIVVKLVSLVYMLLAWTIVPLTLAVPVGLCWLAYACSAWWAVPLAVLALAAAWSLYRYGDGSLPASVGAGGLSSRLGDRFVAWIGTIKFFTSPLAFVADPGSYRIHGGDIRCLIEPDSDVRLEPGDILLRGYDGYVDGELIRRTGGALGRGRWISHAALYVGPIDADRDKAIAARRLQVRRSDGRWEDASEEEKQRVRNDSGYFQAGSQMVIHSMAKGVHVEDILTFLRCDYLIVLRLPECLRLPMGEHGRDPLAVLHEAAQNIDERLRRGEAVTRREVVAAARDSALGRIGSGYGFQFDNCREFHRFSCSEFVYYCLKSVQRIIGLQPVAHSFAGLFTRTTVSPADIYAAAESGGKMRVVWTNIPA